MSGPGYAKRMVSHAWGLVRDRARPKAFKRMRVTVTGQSLPSSLIATSTAKSWNWLKLCTRT